MSTNNPDRETVHMEQASSVAGGGHGSPHLKTTFIMYIFALWVGLFGWLANFDAAFGGIVLTMEPYKKAFGSCHSTGGTETCSVSALQQSLIQLTNLFIGVGGAISGPIGTYLGRIRTLQIGCLFIAIGAAGMIGTEGSFLNYMVCKCVGGVGIGILYTTAPVWGTESVTSQKRGLLMSSYNFGLGLGNVIAAAICVGSARLTNNWSWRTPIICQIPVAVIMAMGSMLFHESPRWLLLNGKEEKARRSFAHLYNLPADSEGINWLMADVSQHIEFEKSMRSTSSWTEIFQGLNLKRTHIAFLVLLGCAITGIQFIIPYTALFLQELGINNPYILTVTISSCVFAGSFLGPFLCEYIGRRRSLLGGYTVMASCMLIASAVSSGLGQSSTTAQNTLVAFFCIWAFSFGATVGPICWVSSAEMHSLRLRTYGQSYAVAIYEIFAFGAAFWTPYLLNPDYGNMGTNVGYFYFGITLGILALTYIFVPETARLSLEQIDEYFVSKRPAWRTSLGRNKDIAKGKASTGVVVGGSKLAD